MKKIYSTLAFVLIGLISMAQGQPSVKIFSNFNYNLSDDENNHKAFEVNRAYLGYKYALSDEFSTKITFDVGKNDGGSAYTAFLKIASISWKANKNINLNFGMIGTKNFKFMEKTWGHRYIYKSLQDKHKWANSADVGVSLDYKISNQLSFDAQVLNGEGYKNIQDKDNGLFRGSLGLTYSVSEDVIVRVHRDIVPREEYTEDNDHQNTTSAALAYSGDGFKLGAEYNIQENAENKNGQEKTGISAYGSYDLGDDMSLFGRFDELSSENDWNLSKDGTFMIVGVQKQMVKGLKVALNYQSWTDATDGAESENTLYLNLEYKF